MALALMMLTGAGLLVRSLERLERIDLGYTSDHLSVISLAIPFTNYGSDPKVAAMLEGLYGRVRAVPGITALTPMLYPPFVGANLWQTRPELEGQSAAESEANVAVPLEFGGVEYFRAFRIPILRGRGFTDADRRNAPGVVVVSEAEAQRFWPGVDPIGKRIRFPGDGTTEWRTVVGIAGETRLRRLSEPTPMMYLPWLQTTTFGTFAVRTRGDLSSVLPAIRRTISDTDPAIEVWNAKTMDDWLAGPLAQPRLSALLLSAFGLVALLLAAVGLYGVMASLVRERTREIGIRTALGATPERMRRDVLAQSLAVCGTGVLVGAGCALATTRVLKSQLFQVSPTDPIVLAGACGLLLAVALIAAYLPARRATRIDPAQALRVE
jgi:predicted permease